MLFLLNPNTLSVIGREIVRVSQPGAHTELGHTHTHTLAQTVMFVESEDTWTNITAHIPVAQLGYSLRPNLFMGLELFDRRRWPERGVVVEKARLKNIAAPGQ